MKKVNKQVKDFLKFNNLSQVQNDVLKHKDAENDLIVCSATGTGKTHAFLFSIMEQIDTKVLELQAVIIVPTRELAMQTRDFLKDFQKFDKALKIELAIGGMNNARLKEALQKKTHILISTPGKLLDVFSWNILRLDTVRLCVVDEMDMMFDYGFIEDVDRIAAYMPKESKFYLFSATLPKGLQNFIQKYLHTPIYLDIKKDEKLKPRIEHILINHRHQNKKEILLDLINLVNPLLMIIFANTIEEVEDINNYLRSYGLASVAFHGDLESRRRKQVIREIENSQIQYVVASDLAARGIDLPEISHVVNYKLPIHDLSFYQHRVGRTGRSGRDGFAYSLVANEDKKYIKKLMNQGIEFEYRKVTSQGLEISRPIVDNYQVKRKRDYDPEIAQIIHRKPKKVKPGYKKKRQQEIERIKKRQRREAYRQEKRKKRK